MIHFILGFGLKFMLSAGSSLNDKVFQTPPEMFKKPGEDVAIKCFHQIASYNQILWYKQSDQQLELLGYLNVDYANPEPGVDVKIGGNANAGQTCTLTIDAVSQENTAVYFCAASVHSVCLGVEVHQSPPQLLVKVGEEAQLVCSHQRGDYRVMQWYQQSPGESALKRIGHLSYDDKEYEDPFKDHFRFVGDLSGSSNKNASMFITKIKPEHSACLSLEVRQTPEEILIKPGGRAEMVCQHSRTDYRQMLWYKYSTENNLMDLIGNLYNSDATMEEPLVQLCKHIYIMIVQTLCLLVLLHSGFSVTVLQSQDQQHCDSGYAAYFGQGTRLTVLEPDRTPSAPSVKVLKPSLNECRIKNVYSQKEKYLTLTCVASKFYPDHVSVTWWRDGNNLIEEVSTDQRARRVDDYYQITSRLRVRAQEWLGEDRNYTCRVSFFDGENTVPTGDSIKGVNRPGPEVTITREEYINVTHMAKLSYVVLIFKSCVYAVFVVFLLWRLQRVK
ncbi:T cell receptor beta chain MC.7.G5-like [Synchiropus splendidus]|uniref:T cell receptor beta chain MC.7.G5-like n=1 Tax=Synchiropus splendidus TaxID=270530 RepID=UPI00237EB5FA|nr:T cell receptor beta chain MC.7.G5-like [Synchiropus splendidus]